MPIFSPAVHPMSSPPFRSGAPPPVMADRIIRARKGNPPQIQFSELSAEEISQTIDCLVEANGLTDAFLLNAIDHRTQRLNLRSCYHIRKYTLGMIPHQCPRLEILDLTNCRQVDSRMVTNLLTQCPKLRELRLEGCVRVTDAAFFPTEMKGSTVPGLRHLTKLFLGGCRQITEDALLRLARICVNLQELSLAGCRSSVSLKVVHAFFDLSLKHQKLDAIDLSDCAVLGSDEAFVQYEYKVNVIGKFVPIRMIRIAGMAGLPPRYTHKSIRALASICGPHLEVLETTWSGGFTDESCFVLAQNCPNISELGICNSLVSLNGIEMLANGLSKLSRLDLSWCVRVNGPVVSACISKCMHSLRALSLSHCVDFLASEKAAFAISSMHVRELLASTIGSQLEVLDLTGLPNVVDAELVKMIDTACPFMTVIAGSVSGTDSVPLLRTAFESWQGHALTSLSLDFTRVHAHVDSVVNFSLCPYPNLEKLVIACNPKFPASDSLLEAILSSQQHLRHLELRNCGGVTGDLFSSWVQGYSPDREAAMLVEAMIDRDLHKGYVSSSSIERPNTVMFASDSEAAAPTVVFRGQQRLRKKNRNFILSSASETDTLVAGFELLKTALVLNVAATAMDALGTLILTGAHHLTDASVDRLSLMATYLERLEITDASQLSEECMEPLRRRCKLLRSIEISGAQIRVRIDSSRFINKRKRNKTQVPPLKRKSSKRSDTEEDIN